MPRFYFDVTDGSFIPDALGTELADIEQARLEAITRSAALLRDYPDQFWEGEEWMVEVIDDYGLGLFTLAFRAKGTPATRSRSPSPSTSLRSA